MEATTSSMQAKWKALNYIGLVGQNRDFSSGMPIRLYRVMINVIGVGVLSFLFFGPLLRVVGVPLGGVFFWLAGFPTVITAIYSLSTWSSVAPSYDEELLARLTSYDPVDKCAYQKLQQRVLQGADGVDSDDLHDWLCAEGDALRRIRQQGDPAVFAFVRKGVGNDNLPNL
ncbi:hypothetical protein [Thiomonas sp.]